RQARQQVNVNVPLLGHGASRGWQRVSVHLTTGTPPATEVIRCNGRPAAPQYGHAAVREGCPMDVVETVVRLFAVGGGAAYFGEAVSQTAHALQSAQLAERAGADDTLVVAALLHDIGHLLHGLPEDVAERGIDARHEHAGAD